jgi:glutamate-1-semialdehyde 2,1-aminomutase
VGGGWHGGSPYLLKGIHYTKQDGFEGSETYGLPKAVLDKIIITRFNDPDDLRKKIKKYGKKLACFILEPFIGVGGFIAASKDYLDLSRELTEEYGIVLIFDEIISGFRFAPSGVQKLYGIEPELSTFGKLLGGGHAIAAVMGKEKLMKMCGTAMAAERRVRFNGGTFSAHTEYMRAGYVMLSYLIENADVIYPEIAARGEQLRRAIENVFYQKGIETKCTGYGNEYIPGSSLFMVNFPLQKVTYRTPEEILNEDMSQFVLREKVLKLALLLEGIHVVHGGGAVSFAHTGEHIEKTITAFEEVAELFRKNLI